MSKYSYCSTLALSCPVYNDIKRTSIYADGYLSAVVSGVNYYYRTNSTGIINEVGVCPTEDFTQYATVGGSYLKKSNDSGLSWYNSFVSAGPANWVKVDVSENGQYVFVTDGSYVLKSSGYGSEFSFNSVKAASSSYFTDIAVSRSGQYVVLAESKPSNSSSPGYIWVSNDYGVNWTAKASIGSREWKNVSISGNGQYMLASAGNNHDRLYRSTNYGVSWSVAGSAATDVYYYQGSAISDTGQYQVVIRNDGWIGGGWQSWIAVSNNYGISWQNTTAGNAGRYLSVDISGTGQYVVAATTNTTFGVRKNNNYGVAGYWSNTGITTPDSNFWGIGVSISSSGKTVLVADADGYSNNYLYLSRNYGASYVRVDGSSSAGSQNWTSVVIAPTALGGGTGPSCPAANIFVDQYCSGFDLINQYTDGNCGIYGTVQEYNSLTCGYNAGENYYCDCGFGCEQYPNPCYYYGCSECFI
jgi:hypothetical protein